MLTPNFALKGVAIAAALGMTALISNSAEAAGFVGPYDVSNWTFESTNGGDGFVDTTDAPDSITIVGSNNNVGSSLTSFTIAAVEKSIVSFVWNYQTNDADGSFFDNFIVLNDGISTQLTEDTLSTDDQTGEFSFKVSEGDVFGFGIDSFDSGFGEALVTISGFMVTEDVPEPATILGTLLFGAIAYRLRKKETSPDVE